MKSFSGLKTKIAFLPLMLSLGPRALLRLIVSTLFSINHYYILGRNLAVPLGYPSGRKPEITLNLLNEEDLAYLRTNFKALSAEDGREILARLHFFESGFSNCYVIKSGDEIAYMQWIIFPSENHLIRQKYSNKFYPLTDKQVMIENAFTFPRYRGQGYLPFATIKLMELAKDNGYASAICYIRKDRIASLNEFSKIGFRITKMVSEYKLLGKVWRTL